VEFPTINEFKDFLDDYTTKYNRYEYVNPFYNKRKKAQPFKVIYLMIGNRYNLFDLYEDTSIYALKDLSNFLEDYIDGLYPELKAPFEFKNTKRGKRLTPCGLRKIEGLHLYWVGKAVNPEKGLY
jgi:hypothetical protein